MLQMSRKALLKEKQSDVLEQTPREKNSVRPCVTSRYALKHVVTPKAELKKPASEVFSAGRQSALKKQTKQA